MECHNKIQKLSILESDGLCLFEKLMEQLYYTDLELVAFLARRIWLRRNSVIFGGEFTSLFGLVNSAQDSRVAFYQATEAPNSSLMNFDRIERMRDKTSGGDG